MVYLYISSKKLENKNFFNFIYIGIKKPKFLGINLTKAMQDLYNKKNKTSVSGLIYVIRVPEKGNGAEKYYF